MNRVELKNGIQGSIRHYGNYTQSVELTVPENGILKPIFYIEDAPTSGSLKYFQNIEGKKVKITLEIINEIQS